MEPLTGFPDCEVGAFRPASGEVPVTAVSAENLTLSVGR